MGSASSDELSFIFSLVLLEQECWAVYCLWCWFIGYTNTCCFNFYTVIAVLLIPCIAAAAGTVINMCGYTWFVSREKSWKSSFGDSYIVF